MKESIEHLHSQVTSSTVAAPDKKGRMRLSIWFFVGILCLIYGLILTPIGIYQLSHPPNIVLPNLHITLWWGLLMTAFGAFYTIRFRPGMA